MSRQSDPPPPSNSSLDAISLHRALSALSSKLLTSTPSPALLHSSYERTKTAANINYAHTLLLQLEKSVASIRVQSRKHAQQKKLASQRAQLKLLKDKLWEIGQRDDGSGIPGAQPDAAVLKVLGLGAGSEKLPSVTIEEVSDESTPGEKSVEDHQPSYSEKIPSSETTSSQLRSRHPSHPGPSPSKTTSFTPNPLAHPDPKTSHKLEADATTHYQLTESMVSLAQRLAASAKKFQDELEADKDAVGRTEGALGKNAEGMDSATRRMGVLSKMSEGRWWWGRMVLYAAIVALWLVALMVVFVGPKLRF